MNKLFQASPFRTLLTREPLTLVDIGARDGVHHRWKAVEPWLRLLAFEPDEAECQRLNAQAASPRETYLPTALSSQTERRPFHVTKVAGCSSLLEPNWKFLRRFPDPARFEIQQTIMLPTDRLDHVLETVPYEVDFIKLDVQGAEMQVLQGAERALAETVFGLEVEVEFAELYRGRPLFAHIDEYLRQWGFILFDLKRCWWKRQGGERLANIRGQLVFGDALYLKDYIAHPAQLKGRGRSSTDSRLLRAIAICVLYEKLDYALELTHFAQDQAILDRAQCAEIEKQLRAQRMPLGWFPNVRGRYRLARWLTQLAYLVAPRHWGPSDLIW